MSKRILEVKQMRTSFGTSEGYVEAIRGIDLHVEEGEILGIVGESGSGKSVAMKSVMGLLPNNAKVESEGIFYKGINFAQKSERELQKYRGKEMAMIFQDPMTAMNPLRKVGYHLTQVIKRFNKCSTKEAEKIAIEMLRQVGISNPEARMKQYPHEFSGGMRQRAVIAMALSCQPSLLICDEPTTALDVTIQAQIMNLLKEIQEVKDTTLIPLIAEKIENLKIKAIFDEFILGLRDVTRDGIRDGGNNKNNNNNNHNNNNKHNNNNNENEVVDNVDKNDEVNYKDKTYKDFDKRIVEEGIKRSINCKSTGNSYWKYVYKVCLDKYLCLFFALLHSLQ